jgi:hypothetical protein
MNNFPNATGGLEIPLYKLLPSRESVSPAHSEGLVGSFSSVGLPDYSNTLTKGARNFIYDVYFYWSTIGYSQALEFDINQFVGEKGTSTAMSTEGGFRPVCPAGQKLGTTSKSRYRGLLEEICSTTPSL